MKLILIFIATLVTALITGSHAMAQVNLSRPINASHSDHIYRATHDEKVAYMMPISMSRLSEVRVSRDAGRIIAHFQVGIPQAEYSRVQALTAAAGIPDLRLEVVRALSAEIEPDSATDIEARFRPRIKVAGDPRNLSGPVRYALSVREIRSKRQLSSEGLFKQLFGPSGADHIGNLRITFDAIALGRPYEGASVIPLFVSERAGGPGFAPTALTRYSSEVPMILFDHESGCWKKPAAGTICLRERSKGN